ncbi:Uncharacterised protein [Mycobacterium tuberculosis]|uniref:Uncharacterized protein n=1 Tax=Mycobacterium tuberculosis TaxID=1773 RepID=A0A655AT14_MYCTX|nr:Uncharacterised protein [Mycobacterium tuberculosis]CKV24635.1 Uncharacterised protein [Mycobacterium tuberculosis]CKW10490.1 Uncharacterised protein [Mycobacterium tuberculosis]
MSFLAEPLDHVDLAFGQHIGDSGVDADLRRHRVGGGPIVAGEQNRPQPAAA